VKNFFTTHEGLAKNGKVGNFDKNKSQKKGAVEKKHVEKSFF